MDDALELCDLAAHAVAMFDPALADADQLRGGVLGLQAHIDRIKVVQAIWLAEADARRVWEGTGARDIADWLAGKTKSSYGDAKRKARLGVALGKSKELSDAVNKGDVSPDAAEQLHDAITDPPEGAPVNELIDSVKGADPREAKEAADRWTQIHANEAPEQAEERRYRKRSITSKPPHDGMVTTTVVLPVLQSRQFHNAITHAAGKPGEADGRTTQQRLADGLMLLCDAYAKGQIVGGREKPTILITFASDAYSGATDEPGVTAHGDLIPAHIVRHLAEQANLQRVLLAGSRVLDLGRQVRFATEDQYRALVARDGGCRWPGCHIPAAWCDVDHLVPWCENGGSDIDSMALLCHHHHQERHRPGVTVLGSAADLRIRLIDGTVLECPTKHQARRPASAAA